MILRRLSQNLNNENKPLGYLNAKLLKLFERLPLGDNRTDFIFPVFLKTKNPL